MHTPRSFNPSTESHSEFLRRKLRMVGRSETPPGTGHYTLCRWMLKQGYPFDYAYWIVFNKQPSKR